MKKIILTIIVLAVWIGAGLDAAKIKVRAEQDRDFDFAAVRTWAWDSHAGRVIMARTATDDPVALKARIDPLIRQSVQVEMAKKGLQEATGTADVHLDYYVLVTLDASGHTMGQFLPAVPYWGLPPFPPALPGDIASRINDPLVTILSDVVAGGKGGNPQYGTAGRN